MHALTILAAAFFAALSGAAPTTHKLWTRDGPYAVDIILAIMPDSKSCDNAPDKNQCRTAAQAEMPFVNAMNKYGITSPWEIGAVLSLTAMESVQLKYKQPANQNNNPDKGKGTSNMQSGDYNLKFAKSIPELKSQVDQITGGSTALTDDQKQKVLQLLQDDQYNFSSGAWFLANECTPAIRQGLQAGTEQGWLDYVLKCVGVPAAGSDQASQAEWAQRKKYWASAMAAFGLTYSA